LMESADVSKRVPDSLRGRFDSYLTMDGCHQLDAPN
jgi:hypothetical protein